MKVKGAIFTLAAAFVVAVPVGTGFSQEAESGGEEKDPMGMSEMMDRCDRHCEETAESVEELSAKVEQAKQSNDPKEMRAALDQVQRHLGEMNDHMKGCRSMMSMMEMMHGEGGMHGMMEEKR